jgi:hypothetical protein
MATEKRKMANNNNNGSAGNLNQCEQITNYAQNPDCLLSVISFWPKFILLPSNLVKVR